MSWTKIIEGTSLEGWIHIDEGDMTLQDDILVTSGGMGLLYYEKQMYEDCILKVIYKNPEGQTQVSSLRFQKTDRSMDASQTGI